MVVHWTNSIIYLYVYIFVEDKVNQYYSLRYIWDIKLDIIILQHCLYFWNLFPNCTETNEYLSHCYLIFDMCILSWQQHTLWCNIGWRLLCWDTYIYKSLKHCFPINAFLIKEHINPNALIQAYKWWKLGTANIYRNAIF